MSEREQAKIAVNSLCTYLVEEFSRFDFCKEGEVNDGHLSGHFFRIKVEDGKQGRGVCSRNLKI